MQDPNQRLNIFTDCNKESSITDADVTSIVVDDVYESKAQDRPESTKTSMLESEVCSLRTDFSHLTSTVENMKAEIVELQKSKLSSSVELTEPRDSNVQHENATASTCDQYDDESILLRCKDIHDILAYFPEMELIREDLTISFIVILTKNVLARAHKKFQQGRHSEIYLLTLKKQDKTKMELPLDMVSISASSCQTTSCQTTRDTSFGA